MARWIKRHCYAIGCAGYLVALLSLLLVDPSHMRAYGGLWAGVMFFISGVFTAGYARYANLKRGEAKNVLVFSSGLVVVGIWAVVARLLPPNPVRDAYISAVIFITYAFLMLWRLVLWATAQIRIRRAVAKEETEHAPE